ncbi:MAG: uracil-DNA glycosylase [Desulfocapsa sp.]|uniref:Uracil-DNA glycosylase n=1 Tax=Desulfotalea psychrophila TaxID=84980 RepID=A0ABS3AVZ0_9BACT|nr:uracil-DNA glycosylase [Desulfocapsa sp.]MBN4048716.1 uracil-DNA glycosylase [bacterium AH-315-N22]MBN4068978.1 uracil-DNA glycosylase [Desulfotalea psychrophila]
MIRDTKKEEDITELLVDIRGVVEAHQASSITHYPASDELKTFFNLRRPLPTPASADIPIKAKESEPDKPILKVKHSDHARLAEIATEVGQCRSCTLSVNRKTVIAGKGGGNKIRLFIIGHWLSVLENYNTELVFGLEEDQMLVRMLAAINLPMEEVFVSNVIKCGLRPDIRPQAEHIATCASYLQRQINAASPECICTMGMVATRTMLRRSQPLSQLRGRFHPYKAANGVEIPLLPTYHPGYLLQNPEMKNATWQDLQLLQKRLL